jgi:hypothetical protein
MKETHKFFNKIPKIGLIFRHPLNLFKSKAPTMAQRLLVKELVNRHEKLQKVYFAKVCIFCIICYLINKHVNN